MGKHMINELQDTDLKTSIHHRETQCRRFQAKCVHKAVWSHSNTPLGSDVCTCVTSASRYQVVFVIADTSLLLWMEAGGCAGLLCWKEPGCHTWALICVIVSYWTPTPHTHTHSSSLRLSFFIFSLMSFPHPPTLAAPASVVNSLDLEHLWCHDFTWRKRTCLSLLETTTYHLCPTGTLYRSFSDSKKPVDSHDTCAF